MRINKTSKQLAAFSLALLVAAGLAAGNLAMRAHDPGPATIGEEVPFTGNPTCKSLDTRATEEVKCDPVGSSFTCTHPDFPALSVDVEVYDTADGQFLDWDQNPHLPSPWTIVSVLVKGGSGSKPKGTKGPAPTGGFIYFYSETGPVRADEGLHSSLNPNGKYAAVSHVSFCGVRNDTEFEGCTLGYWKQSHHFDSWPSPYTPDSNLQSAFGVTAFDDSFINALEYQGGPSLDDAKGLLLKQGVAALLSATHPDVNYPISAASVIFLVQSGLQSSDRAAILSIAETLNGMNNLGCPLN